MIDAIEVVYLYVPDVAAAVAFYERALGLSFEQFDEHWAETRVGGTRFAFHLGERAEPGTAIFDFRVDDIDESVALLRDRGIDVGEITRVPHGSFAQFRDLNGYRVELFQPA